MENWLTHFSSGIPDDYHSLPLKPGLHGGTPGAVQGASIQAGHISYPLPEVLAEQSENFSSGFDPSNRATVGITVKLTSRQSLEAANGAVIEMMEDSLLPSPCCSIPAGPCFIGAFARKNYSDLNQVANSRKFRQ